MYFSAVEEKGIALVNIVKGASRPNLAIKGREFPWVNLIWTFWPRGCEITAVDEALSWSKGS